MTTPVHIWAPAFDHAGFPWLKTFPVNEVFGPRGADGKFPCRMCEDRLYDTGPDFNRLHEHARHHKFEFAAWKAEQKAQGEMVV